MANIIFDIEYSNDEELNNEIRSYRDAFRSLLDKNTNLNLFNAEITITNRNEHDLTKFVLKNVDPKNKEVEVIKFLNVNYPEYLGG